MQDVLDPTNADINSILLDLRTKLRAALVAGSFGDFVQTEPAPVHNGQISKWKLGFVPAMSLTKAPGKRTT